MLIKKLPSRKINTPPAYLRNLILKIYEAEGPEINTVIKDILDKNLPKSDLNNWIGVLNKFDKILEDLIKKYELNKIQKIDFEPNDRETLIGILTLTKILFEKCTNRNLYCSYERLNLFLNTNDIEILTLLLTVLIRPAQRVSAQKTIKINFSIDASLIIKLLQPWIPHIQGIGIKELISYETEFKPDCQSISFQFFPEKSETQGQHDSSGNEVENDNNLYIQKNIHIPDPYSKGSNPTEIFFNLVEEHNIPEKYHYEFFHKVRVSLFINDPIMRSKLLIIRLLAIAIYCYITNESHMNRNVFTFEPNLISDIANILQQKELHYLNLQTAALNALEAISHLPGKMNEILSSISAGASHGPLVSILKRITSLEAVDDPKFVPFVDSLFPFFVYAFTSQSGGNLLITAGIIPVLAQFLSLDGSCAPIRVIYKGIQLMDNAIYGFASAFGAFQSINGLEILVKRIEQQVQICLDNGNPSDIDYSTQLTDTIRAIEDLILLKGLLKFVLHMMQASTTGGEIGLRNLIETSLTSSIKTIFEHPALFSPSVYPQAVLIMSNIVHNEPTSLTILQEKGLPQTFLNNLIKDIPPAGETIHAIACAFGAICLNANGLEFFKESKALDLFFDMFRSPDYVYCLDEIENFNQIGNAIDEFIRHNPAFKETVFNKLISVLRTLIHLGGENFEEFSNDVLPYIEKYKGTSLRKHLVTSIEEASEKPDYGIFIKEENIQYHFLKYIDNFGRFLEGFFENSNNFDEFTKYGGLDLLAEIYSLKALPNDFPSTLCSFTTSHLFQSSTETSLPDMVNAIANKMQSLLDNSEPWLKAQSYESYAYLVLKDESTEKEEKLNQLNNYAKSLHAIIELFSGFSDTEYFNQENMHTVLTDTLLSAENLGLISSLMELWRISQWDHIFLQENKMIGNFKQPSNGDSSIHEYDDPVVKMLHTDIYESNSHLSSLFKGISKVTTPKSMVSAEQRKSLRVLSLTIAKAFKDSILWDRVHGVYDVYSMKYFTAVLFLMENTIFDKKRVPYVLISLLMAFEEVDLIQLIFDKLKTFCELALKSILSGEPSNGNPPDYIDKCFSSMLSFVNVLNTEKHYSQYPYIVDIYPPESEGSDAIVPNEILLKIRDLSNDLVSKIWTNQNIKQISSIHFQILSTISVHIIECKELEKIRINPRYNQEAPIPPILTYRRPEADQERIQQLVDMGFPRSASRLALIRNNNNISRATDYLLSHPEVVATAGFDSPNDESQNESNNTNQDNNPNENEGQEEQEEEQEENQEEEGEEQDESISEGESQDNIVIEDEIKTGYFQKREGSIFPTIEEASNKSDTLSLTILKSIYEIMDHVEGSINSIRDLTLSCFNRLTYRDDMLESLKQEIQKHIKKVETDGEHVNQLINRLKFLGFLIQSDSSQEYALPIAGVILQDLFEIATYNVEGTGDINYDPKTIAISLMLVDVILLYSEEPSYEEPVYDLEAIQQNILSRPPLIQPDVLPLEKKAILLKSLLKYLESNDRDLLCSTFRLTARLTKISQLAELFIEIGGCEILMNIIINRTEDLTGAQQFLIMIFRNLIETPNQIAFTMEIYLERLLANAKPRMTEITNFFFQNAGLVYRNTDIFKEVLFKKCTINRYEPKGRIPSITLQKPSNDHDQHTATERSSNFIPPLEDKATRVLHFLIYNLMNFKRSEAKGESEEDKLKVERENLAQCTILQLLTEIFVSFPSCRVEYLTSRKHKFNESRDQGFKYYTSRTQFINFLLNELLPVKNIENPIHIMSEQTPCLFTNWATSLLCSLLIGSDDEFIDSKCNELAPIRKFVLDLIAKAYQEASTIPNLNHRYGKFMTLSTLCHRALTGDRSYFSSKFTRNDELVVQSLAKIMLDKKFVPIFISIINDMDLNFPSLRNLVVSILLPLEDLAKLSLKIGQAEKASEKTQGTEELETDSDELSVSSLSESNETEDMLRNSALGVMDGTANMVSENEDDLNLDSEEMQEELGYSSEGSDEETEDEDDEMDDEFESLLELNDLEGEYNGSILGSEEEGIEEESEWESPRDVGNNDDSNEEEEEEGEEDNGDELGDDVEGVVVENDELNFDLSGDDVFEMEEMLDEYSGDDNHAEVITGVLELPGGRSLGRDDSVELARLATRLFQHRGIGHGQEGRIRLPFRIPGIEPIGLDSSSSAFVESFPGYHPRRFQDTEEHYIHPLLSNQRVVQSNQPSGPNNNGSEQNSISVSTINMTSRHSDILSHLFGHNASASSSNHPLLNNLLQSLESPFREALMADPYVRNLNPRTNESKPQAPQKPLLKELLVCFSHHRWRLEVYDLYPKNAFELAKRLIPSVLNVFIQNLPSEISQRPESDNSNQNAQSSSRFLTGASNLFNLSSITQSSNGLTASDSRNDTSNFGGRVRPFADLSGIQHLERLRLSENRFSDLANLESIGNQVEVSNQPEPQPQPQPEPEPEPEPEQEAQPAQQTNTNETNTESNAPSDQNREAAQQPVTITIHGNVVDITNTGIDPAFLEALPDELRQEVISGQLESSHPPPAGSTEIDSEFLDAIPQELRNQVFFTERNRDITSLPEPRSNNAPALGIFTSNLSQNEGHPAILPLSFSLNRGGAHPRTSFDLEELQRRVLNSAREHRLIIEPGTQVMLNNTLPTFSHTQGIRRSQASGNQPAHGSAIQIVDQYDLASLIRLLFFSHTIGKTISQRILFSLCENVTTCENMIALLLLIVHEGAENLASVDKTLAYLNLRPKAAIHKQQYKSIFDTLPNFVTQRCFELLSRIFTLSHGLKLFMKDYELLGSRRAPKRSKLKEKVHSSKSPIVVLISLLERNKFLVNPSLLDQLTHLISIASKQLSSFYKSNLAKNKTAEVSELPNTAIEHRPILEASSSKNPEVSVGDNNPPKPKTAIHRAPHIPESCLRAIVSILYYGDCSNKAFQYIISTVQSLSILPGAQNIFVDELVKQSHVCGDVIMNDLSQVLGYIEDPNSYSNDDVQMLVVEKFSPVSSSQARLLRILKLLDFMEHKAKSKKTENKSKDDSLLSQPSFIYNKLRELKLWNYLSDTLLKIQDDQELINIATVLLPLIESFMIVCKYGELNELPVKSIEDDSNIISQETSLFFQFTEKHRKLLNIIVRNNPGLMSGTFSLLIKNHKVLDFDNKRTYFTQQLHKRNSNQLHQSTIQLNVRRQYVFEDSYRQFSGRSGDEIKYGKLNVKFHDEEGVDAGGVTREWFSVLSRQMFDPNYALFTGTALDKVTYQPNRMSFINPDHLQFFKFIGRVIGKAIYNEILLDAYFTRSFYKHILGKQVEIKDLEAVDPEFHKSLTWMLENDITDVMDLNFTIDTEIFGQSHTTPLKPDGENILVTEENKHEYVKLVTEQKLYLDIKDQVDHFVKGFYEIIPKDLVSIFDEQELELLISGLPDIDIDDWKNNTVYEGYTSSSPQIHWFWRAVRSFDQPEKAKLLQFVTGTSKVPLEGFSNLQGSNGTQKFQIHKDFASVKRLPSAHTCFNQLDLPFYESYEELRRQLLKAIEECNTGFGFS